MEKKLDKADSLYREGKYNDALKILDCCLRSKLQFKDEEYAQNLKIKCHFHMKGYTTAISLVETYMVKFKQFKANGLLLRAECLYKQSKYGEAYKCLREAEKEAEKYGCNSEYFCSKTKKYLAKILIKFHRYKDALIEINKVPEAEVGKSISLKNKILNYLGNFKKTADTIQEFGLALQLDDDEVSHSKKRTFLRVYMTSLFYSNSFDLLTKLYEERKEEFPEVCRYFKAKMLIKKNDYLKALSEVEKIQSLKNYHYRYQIYLLKAEILEKISAKEEEIITELEKAIDNNSYKAEAYEKLATLYKNKLDVQNTVKTYSRRERFIDEENQKPFELLFYLSKAEFIFLYEENHKEAKEIYEYTVKSLSNNQIKEKFVTKELIQIFEKTFSIASSYYNYELCDLVVFPKSIIKKRTISNTYMGIFQNKETKEAAAVKIFKLTEKEEEEDEEKKKNILEKIFNLTYKIQRIYFYGTSPKECKEEDEKNLFILPLASIIYIKEVNLLYFITPYCEGGDLYTILFKKKIKISNLNKIIILVKIAEALRFLYDKKITHNNLKLSNIFLYEEYNDKKTPKVFLSDFKKWELNEGDEDLSFPSPELISTKKPNLESDVYSFGYIIFGLFQKGVSFKNGTDLPSCPTIDFLAPKELKDLIVRCIKKDKTKRPKIEEILRTLKDIRKDLTPSSSSGRKNVRVVTKK